MKLRNRLKVAFAAITNSRELMEYLSGTGVESSYMSDSGMLVTPETAMRLATVWACIRILSEDIASLPLDLLERNGKSKNLVTGHWLPDLMNMPNSWQTGFEFREMQQTHIELNGNFLALKTVNPRSEILEILPTHWSRWTTELLPNWKMQYKFTFPDGSQNVVPNDRVYHVRGLSLDGIMGLSPIAYQRETIGFGMALLKYGNKLFKNGANVSGVIEVEDTMTDKAYTRLKESFDEKYTGLDNAAKSVLLEEGAKFKPTSMKADDAQFLESRKLSRTEICGIYRVPPHFIGDLERATFSNIEQQSKDYIQKALLPRLRRLESRMLLSFIPRQNRTSWFFRHDVDELLRGDFEARMRGYQTAILTGWLNRNEARSFENLNPGPDELNEFLVPSNELLAKNLEDNAAAGNTAPAKGPTPKEESRALSIA